MKKRTLKKLSFLKIIISDLEKVNGGLRSAGSYSDFYCHSDVCETKINCS